MNTPIPIFIATVCLERNRWGSKQPSFLVSDWLGRWAADGFDGVELWENHYLLADVAEQARLRQRVSPLTLMYNTYARFGDDPAEAAERGLAVEAVGALRATGVKYNIGRDAARIDEYRRNLRAWAQSLPVSCRLLCECHPGTVIEKVEDAARFFAGLDPVRFGVIAHLMGDPAALEGWVAAFGNRLGHIHMQQREPATDPATPGGMERARACVSVLASHGYSGSLSVEFTRGIGKDERIETLYTCARADRAAVQKAWLEK